MNDKIVLLSKDILRADYLEPYGQKYWKTPNINKLAKEGTLFKKHYTAAPSSAMALTCMLSGLFAYELNRKKYTEVKPFNQVPTLFDELQKRKYSCHIIWDERWYNYVYRFTKSYGNTLTKFHNIKIEQIVSSHKIDKSKLKKDDGILSIEKILREVDSINDNKMFIWIHIPHVLQGRTGYGSDIDLFDRLVGELRNRFEYGSIYITADHGHMNLEKGIPTYAHHVYEGAIKIPLITPKINGKNEINFPTSNIQLKEIILENNITKRDFIFSDSKYYAQPDRRLAIIKDNYKYIYNKKEKTEELYDLDWDKNEDVNLLKKRVFEKNRHLRYYLNEIYFYPYWEKVPKILNEFRNKKEEIWRTGSKLKEKLNGLKSFVRRFIK